MEHDKGLFTCSLCGLNEKFDYFGTRPPYLRSVQFKEKLYLMKDPFQPYGQGLFIVLGSHCSLCDKVVCQSQDCSIYYSKRFCMGCAQLNAKEFPLQILKEIKPLKAESS